MSVYYLNILVVGVASHQSTTIEQLTYNSEGVLADLANCAELFQQKAIVKTMAMKDVYS